MSKRYLEFKRRKMENNKVFAVTGYVTEKLGTLYGVRTSSSVLGVFDDVKRAKEFARNEIEQLYKQLLEENEGNDDVVFDITKDPYQYIIKQRENPYTAEIYVDEYDINEISQHITDL